MTDDGLAISTRNLTKIYKAQGKAAAKTALEDVSLDIPRGSLFALLGPNGAGKSTFINILAGLVNKTSGTAVIDRLDISTHRIKSKFRIGIVPQELHIDPFFTPLEAMELQGGLYGVPKNQRRSLEILEALGLGDKANVYSRTLSGGMRRRLMVAKAMVHNPPILVLDEPTAGVDIELRRQLWAYVQELNRQGTTILLTTHYLEEAEQLCDRIGVINKGRLIANDSKQAMLSRIDMKTLTMRLQQPITAIPAALLPYKPVQPQPDVLSITFRRAETPMAKLLQDVQASGIEIADVKTSEARLEDIFLELIHSAH